MIKEDKTFAPDDTTLSADCGNCGHPKSYHYFGDRLCQQHGKMHTPCGWSANSVRCDCHEYALAPTGAI